MSNPGDRGDRWVIMTSKDFISSFDRSTATVVIQIVCPNGGIRVHDGAVRDGYDPPGNVEDKACDSAATFTHTAGDYTLNKNLTIYVPDGVEGYFPYTIVASASS